MNKTAQELGYTVQIEATGDVTPDLVDYARQKVATVGRYTSQPILFAKVVLSYAGDRAVERRASAQASLDWNGRPIRARVACETMRGAIDALDYRLRDRFVRDVRNWETLRNRRSTAERPQWRHGAPVTERPDWFERPLDERELIAHGSIEFGTATPDEAAFDLEMLDYSFLLFQEQATGSDSVIYKTSEGYGLAQRSPNERNLPKSRIPLMVSPVPAPVLSVDQAITRLDMTGLRFVFFEDPTTGRAVVIYHRHDGHLGLITPSN